MIFDVTLYRVWPGPRVVTDGVQRRAGAELVTSPGRREGEEWVLPRKLEPFGHYLRFGVDERYAFTSAREAWADQRQRDEAALERAEKALRDARRHRALCLQALRVSKGEGLAQS